MLYKFDINEGTVSIKIIKITYMRLSFYSAIPHILIILKLLL